MNYKQACRFCNTLIDNNSYYCPYCGRKLPCGEQKEEDNDLTAADFEVENSSEK